MFLVSAPTFCLLFEEIKNKRNERENEFVLIIKMGRGGEGIFFSQVFRNRWTSIPAVLFLLHARCSWHGLPGRLTGGTVVSGEGAERK